LTGGLTGGLAGAAAGFALATGFRAALFTPLPIADGFVGIR
jgi:hypothetical protein